MHKVYMIAAFFSLLFMLIIVGCGGDEECASCPEPVPNPLGFTRAFIVLDNGSTFMNMEIYGNGSMFPDLDSIKVGDSIVPRTNWDIMMNFDLTDLYYNIQFEEGGYPATYMYDHGDTATIKVWGEGRSSTCRVKVLDYLLAEANITYPSEVDTIAPGAADTIFWNRIEGVDYYACVVGYLLAWEPLPILDYYFTTDTSFIIAGTMYDSRAEGIQFFVDPFNGPDPRTGRSNWTGNLLGGGVYSMGMADFVSIYLLQPTKTPGMMPQAPEKRLPQLSSEEIIANLYRKYMQ